LASIIVQLRLKCHNAGFRIKKYEAADMMQ
jgi:hypothetical protein